MEQGGRKRAREEWKEGTETNRLRGEKIEKERHCREKLGGKEARCEDQMTANTERGQKGGHMKSQSDSSRGMSESAGATTGVPLRGRR